MASSAFQVVILLAAFSVLAESVTAKKHRQAVDSTSSTSEPYDEVSFEPDTSDADISFDDPSSPPSPLSSGLGPLLSLLQPLLGGIFGGGAETDPSAPMYPPLLKPLFTPLPIFPGLGIIPSTLAAQASDFLSKAAESARLKFADVAKESAARSQANYVHIVNAVNELNNPEAEDERRRRR